MNLIQIENKIHLLGYSFHDATITSIEIDYLLMSAILTLSVFSNNTEEKRAAILSLSGLKYLVTDPPDPVYAFSNAGFGDIMDDPEYRMIYETTLCNSDFIAKFWMNHWNSYIHIAASDANITLI